MRSGGPAVPSRFRVDNLLSVKMWNNPQKMPIVNVFDGRGHAPVGQTSGRKRRISRLLLTTDTLLMAMAAPANMGLSSQPVNG